MRKIVVAEFMSLDGVMQAPGGADEDTEGGFAHGGWTWPYWHDDLGVYFCQPYRDDLVRNERQAAADLAQFVIELRRIDPCGAPRGGRKPLRELDSATRVAIEASRSVIDNDAAAAAWASALEAPEWDGTPVWIHTDLLRPQPARKSRPALRGDRLRRCGCRRWCR